MLYNVEGSDFYVLADKLSKGFEKKFRSVPNASSAGTPVKQPTFKEKMDFSENMYKITPQQLGRVVQIIEEKDAGVVKKNKGANDEIMISIDEISAEVFHELNTYVVACLPSKKRGGSKKEKQTSKKHKSQ